MSEQICNCISSSVACILRDRVLFGIALTTVITLAAYRAAANAADAFEGGVSVKRGTSGLSDRRKAVFFVSLIYTLYFLYFMSE